jgi:aspartate carbamoyltransferase
MKRLGGDVITFHASSSSLKKGEDEYDTLRSLCCYGDVIVLRHPSKEFIYNILKKQEALPPKERVSIINGGNGDGDHPTQALVDLYTMYKKFGNDFTKKSVLFVGDIAHSRTIHSFITLLNHYHETKIYFLPYEGCEPTNEYIQNICFIHNQYGEDIVINRNDIQYNNYDVVYITRNQKERHVSFTTPSCDYCFTNREANALHEDAIIMHPLPRNHEIHKSVDKNHRAYYFKQMEYSIELRMGLLEYVFMNTNATQEKKKDFITVVCFFMLSIYIIYESIYRECFRFDFNGHSHF